jgi:NAD(P)-dependent dehydrogenase (short-subunit alcohol dehydrogenase family)
MPCRLVDQHAHRPLDQPDDRDARHRGRFGASEEVADAAVMLATNAYVTGQTINVNGGRYMT